jgi:hypothetical protein
MRSLLFKETHTAQSLQQLSCTVILGSPSRNCQGHGICMVLPNHFSADLVCVPQKVSILRTARETLIFEFKLNDLIESDKIKHFGSTLFFIEENFKIPRWLSKKMGIQLGFIAKGYYKLLKTSASIRIELNYKTY